MTFPSIAGPANASASSAARPFTASTRRSAFAASAKVPVLAFGPALSFHASSFFGSRDPRVTAYPCFKRPFARTSPTVPEPRTPAVFITQRCQLARAGAAEKAPCGGSRLQSDATLAPPERRDARASRATRRSRLQNDATLAPPERRDARASRATRRSRLQSDARLAPPERRDARASRATRRSRLQNDATLAPPERRDARASSQSDARLAPPERREARSGLLSQPRRRRRCRSTCPGRRSRPEESRCPGPGRHRSAGRGPYRRPRPRDHLRRRRVRSAGPGW